MEAWSKSVEFERDVRIALMRTGELNLVIAVDKCLDIVNALAWGGIRSGSEEHRNTYIHRNIENSS